MIIACVIFFTDKREELDHGSFWLKAALECMQTADREQAWLTQQCSLGQKCHLLNKTTNNCTDTQSKRFTQVKNGRLCSHESRHMMTGNVCKLAGGAAPVLNKSSTLVWILSYAVSSPPGRRKFYDAFSKSSLAQRRQADITCIPLSLSKTLEGCKMRLKVNQVK